MIRTVYQRALLQGEAVAAREEQRAKSRAISAIAIALIASCAYWVQPWLESELETHDTATIPVTDLGGYTYQEYDGDLASVDHPKYHGHVVSGITTDWGMISLGRGWKQISRLMYGSVSTSGTFYDIMSSGYWYENGTSGCGRPFESNWSGWHEIRDDASVAVFEHYAQAPSRFSGVDEWNATVRFAVLKHDPYVKIDAWIRFVNPDSKIVKMSVNPCHWEPDSWEGLSHGFDESHMMSYRLGNDGTWAVGVIGAQPVDTGGNVYCSLNRYMARGYQYRPTESFHFNAIMVIGRNLTDLRDKAENLGDAWNHHESRNDYNLVLAKNGRRVDCLRYFPDSGYSFVPTGISESLFAGGAASLLRLAPNPILNYARIPVVITVDDNAYAAGQNESFDWLWAEARKYDISVTFASSFSGIYGDIISTYINLSNERQGTLFEIADHGYNHSSFAYPESYDTNYALFAASKSVWQNLTDLPLYSEAVPFCAWGPNTWDALGAAGCRNLRLSHCADGWTPPQDYNVTGPGNGLFLTHYYGQGLSFVGDERLVSVMRTIGCWITTAHPTDFDSDQERKVVDDFFSWLQNQTELVTTTFSQYSDLWHHRILFSNPEGIARVDMTSCLASHRIYLPASFGTLVFRDLSTGELSYPVTMDENAAVFNAARGHVYEALPGAGAVTVG